MKIVINNLWTCFIINWFIILLTIVSSTSIWCWSCQTRHSGPFLLLELNIALIGHTILIIHEVVMLLLVITSLFLIKSGWIILLSHCCSRLDFRKIQSLVIICASLILIVRSRQNTLTIYNMRMFPYPLWLLSSFLYFTQIWIQLTSRDIH